jgi:hypothetical protein
MQQHLRLNAKCGVPRTPNCMGTKKDFLLLQQHAVKRNNQSLPFDYIPTINMILTEKYTVLI